MKLRARAFTRCRATPCSSSGKPSFTCKPRVWPNASSRTAGQAGTTRPTAEMCRWGRLTKQKTDRAAAREPGSSCHQTQATRGSSTFWTAPGRFQQAFPAALSREMPLFPRSRFEVGRFHALTDRFSFLHCATREPQIQASAAAVADWTEPLATLWG